MASSYEPKSKAGSEVWDRLNQQSDFIGELARNQAALEANVAALAESVRTGFDGINANLNRFAERDSRPTNWFGAISAIVIVGGAILTLNSLQTDQVRMKAMENAGRLESTFQRELTYAESHGKMQAEISQLREELEKVDQYGSRRWIRDRE